MVLRLAVWNCNMRLHDKLEGLRLLAPDVIVVPECACPEVLLRRAPALTAATIAWTGRSPRQGLAILAFAPWSVAADRAHDPRGGTTIAAHVHGPATFRLAAAWAAPGAREPLGRALARLGPFLSEGPAAIAGDFNRDLPRGGTLARRIEALGFRSAYHHVHAVRPGDEPEPTLVLRRREGLRGHRDALLLDPRLLAALRGVTVGPHASWTRASDHAPIVARIDTRPLLG